MTRTQMEIGVITALIGTGLTYLFGDFDVAFKALLIFITLDYLTGWLAAWFSASLNSLRGWRGICKKIMTLAVVIVANQIDLVLSLGDTTRSLAVFFLLGNEGLSILENLAALGIPLPPVVRERLEQLRVQKEVKKNAASKNQNLS